MAPETVVRTAVGADAAAVRAVITEAFGDEGERDAHLWAEVEESGLALAGLVAEQAGEVVGHVGLSRAWVDARRELVDVWLLSPLSVRPDRQRRGVGSRLVAAAIDTAREGGAPLLFLEGSPVYYSARGFQPAGEHGFRPPSVRTPAPAFQVVRFAAAADWMTGQLIYRDVWWRHDAAGLRDPLLAQVEEALR